MNYNFIIVDGYIIGTISNNGLPYDMDLADMYMDNVTDYPESEFDEDHENWSYMPMGDINMRLILKDSEEATDLLENAGDLFTLFNNGENVA